MTVRTHLSPLFTLGHWFTLLNLNHTDTNSVRTRLGFLRTVCGTNFWIGFN